MSDPLRLLACLSHPDDESLGTGGTLATYAAEGVEAFVLTATSGDAGRYKGVREGPTYPGREALGRIREAELVAACEVLGARESIRLHYHDGELDRADPREVIPKIAAVVRRLRPQVVLTFGPDGAYGHPDHIAICQFTTAAITRAASPDPAIEGAPHTVSKLYYMTWPESSMKAYTENTGLPHPTVDGVVRGPVAWPDWEITTRLDTWAQWPRVWKAVLCHDSQSASWQGLDKISEAHRRIIWGTETYYRAFSLVNGGRKLETDLFDGLR